MNITITDAYYSTPDGDSIAVVVDGIPFHLSPDHPHEDPWISALLAWQIDGGVIRAYAPPTITSNDVDRERDRRINGGFTFNGVRFQSRPQDRENIGGASTAALSAIVGGAQPGDLRWHGGDTDFGWIAEDNSIVTMDAQTMFAFGQAAMSFKQSMIFAARAIKDFDPIPDNYTDDIYW